MTIRSHIIHIDGSDRTYSCREDQDLLRAMEWCNQRGIPIGCRNGGCGICRLRILHGDFVTAPMSSRHISKADLSAGYVLACRTRPRSTILVQKAQETIVTTKKSGEI